MKISKTRLISILKNITDYAMVNTCLHDGTHRGGVLWEICDECGMAWADDEGGKPEDYNILPAEIRAARDLLEELTSK